MTQGIKYDRAMLHNLILEGLTATVIRERIGASESVIYKERRVLREAENNKSGETPFFNADLTTLPDGNQ
jgi:hypothetical protein